MAPLEALGGSALFPDIFIGQDPKLLGKASERTSKFLFPRSAFTAPIDGYKLYMSHCINRKVVLVFSVHFLPLNGLPLLSKQSEEPSLHSVKKRPKFSAGTTCSHSILVARFLCEVVV